MDLFDTGGYFARKLPMLAATRRLLRYAACALAAKHIRRTYHLLPGHHHVRSNDFNRTDWQYESVHYYHQAIHLLMEAVRLAERREGLYGQRTRPNDLLAAIAILCMYELMDAPGPEWKAHLSALPLLDTASCSILTTQTSISAQGISAKRSIFWSFARQDCLAACELFLAS